MVSPIIQPPSEHILYKIEQLPDKFVHRGKMPDQALLLDTIKPLEIELQKRRIIESSLGSTPVHPLWFIAETERNVFLWRNGFSLSHGEYFECWVDMNRLVEKRLGQLKRNDPNNPVSNSHFDEIEEIGEASTVEAQYLMAFKEAISSIAAPAHAIGMVASEVRRELIDGVKRPVILLPFI